MTIFQAEAPLERFLDYHTDRLVEQTGAVNPIDVATGRNGAKAPANGFVLEARITKGNTGIFTWYAYSDGMLRLSEPENDYTENGSGQTRSVWMDLAPGHARASFLFTPEQGFTTLAPSGGPAPVQYGTRLLLGESPSAGYTTHCMALIAPDFDTVRGVLDAWGDGLGLTKTEKFHFTSESQLQILRLEKNGPLPPEPPPSLGSLVVNFLRN